MYQKELNHVKELMKYDVIGLFKRNSLSKPKNDYIYNF